MIGSHEDEGGASLKSAVRNGCTMGGGKQNEASIAASEEGGLRLVFPPVAQAKSDGPWNTLSRSPRGHTASPS